MSIKEGKKGEESEFFFSIKEELKGKNYSNKANTYIDIEISEALSQIKTRGKIPIAALLSYIVENWIKEHKEEIDKLPTNKYLK